MRRLNAHNLETIPALAKPTYDREVLNPSILHIGVGNFHRAHQATFTDDLLNAGHTEWAILGASLKSPTVPSQLTPQDGLYTLAITTPEVVDRRAVGAILDVIDASSDQSTLIAAISNPDIQVITLTVTEKGYCYDGSSLDRQNEDVIADLSSEGHRQSLPGVLCAGLQARRAAGNHPITLMSCDNLMGNGKVLERVVLAFAAVLEPDLQSWITQNVTFPSSMVDRIVPQTTQADRDAFTAETGLVDAGLVVCEPFKQWVIEDDFAGQRPPWELVGAEFVSDVTPFEEAKLRLLNGPHSACAYLGILSGYDFVHQVIADAKLKQFLQSLVAEEIHPVVVAPPEMNLVDYSATVFARFANSAIAYGTRQVGSDGSQKLPQRLLPCIKQRLSDGKPITHLAVVLACWLEHLQDPAPDPLAEELTTLYQTHQKADALLNAIDASTTIFDILAEHKSVVFKEVVTAVEGIRSMGLKTYIATLA